MVESKNRTSKGVVQWNDDDVERLQVRENLEHSVTVTTVASVSNFSPSLLQLTGIILDEAFYFGYEIQI